MLNSDYDNEYEDDFEDILDSENYIVSEYEDFESEEAAIWEELEYLDDLNRLHEVGL